MSQEAPREVISVPMIADGNPATAMALERQARALSKPVDLVELGVTSSIVRRFHERMTSDPDQAETYTDSSEQKRSGPAARVYSHLSFLEFAMRCSMGKDGPKRWNVVQEHQLQGAIPGVLKMLDIDQIRLAVPDVHPKESAVAAAQKHPNVTVSVWNADARDELVERGVPVELNKPYFLDGLRPNKEEFHAGGVPVVVKSSGSGMPSAWQDALEQTLTGIDQGWAMHTPTQRFASNGMQVQTDRGQRIESFFNDLGGHTRLVIGYPSELVGVVCDLRERDVPAWMIALPPRGAHEKRNLEFAARHGVVLGELTMDNAATSTVAGLPGINVAELPDVLRDLPETKWQQGVVGTEPFWGAGGSAA